ncbi:hypothetical protein SAMN04515671_3194 [Nakamurella panacisegetis]|uniref:Uncharacterized protein n=1 Tax=Nakamurella panacisegetis TaxID=1090615 RepID=A0A1H0QPM8_9ACTN|nr:hypothetical protein [Nakamurella panacisegetis]SDP19212.1 hypothetical protein SAMN04515671_3194 [Nakamurella panacisegetis]
MATAQVVLTVDGVGALVAAVEAQLSDYRVLPATAGRAYEIEGPTLLDNGWLSGTVIVPMADRSGENGINAVATTRINLSLPHQSVLALIHSVRPAEKK